LGKYTNRVSKAKTPNEILDALDDFIASPPHRRSRGGANAAADVGPSIKPEETSFTLVGPVEWWNEYAAMAAHGYDQGS
jgi:hypothetical protein